MDLNIDFKKLKFDYIKDKLLKLADKKTLIRIGIGAGAVIFFLIIYYAVLNPIVNKKKLQIDDMNQKKEETAKFVQEIKSKQRKIKKLKPRYNEYSTLFHSRAEVEGLYNALSVYAGENDLVISKIEKKEIKQVTKSDALSKVAKKGKKKKKKKRRRKKERLRKKMLLIIQFPWILKLPVIL